MWFVSRLTTAMRLTVASVRLLRSEPRLVLLPAAGGLSAIGFTAIVFLVMSTGSLFGGVRGWIALAVVYLVSAFVTAFFAAALSHAVYERFRGSRPPLAASVAAAWQRRWPLFAWATVAAIVGLVLRWFTESDSAITRIIGSTFAMGWLVATFFVVPAIMFENVSARGMFTRSVSIFKQTWGETLSTGLGLGIIGIVAGIVALAIVTTGTVALGQLVALPSGVYVWSILGAAFAAYLFGRTVRTIVRTALYVYARDGVVPTGFSGFDFDTLDGRAG